MVCSVRDGSPLQDPDPGDQFPCVFLPGRAAAGIASENDVPLRWVQVSVTTEYVTHLHETVGLERPAREGHNRTGCDMR